MSGLFQDGIRVSATPLLGLLVGLLGFLVALGFYRLFLHNLAHVPGPKIAALTGWYEFYWDGPKKGRYFARIQDMHKKYGPIVRVNPWEVHINDPNFFDTFYSNSKLDKHAWFYHLFGDNSAAVGTSTWELHKVGCLHIAVRWSRSHSQNSNRYMLILKKARRGAMAKFFSSANIAKLEPKVQTRVQRLLDRVDEHRLDGKVINISNAYRCLATDVISDYAAPHTREFLSTPDFSAAFNQSLKDLSKLMLWHRHIPILFPVMNAIPKAVIAKMDPASVAVLDNRDDLLKQARTVMENNGIPQEKQSPTVLDAIYTSPLIGKEDKTLSRLLAEAQAVLGAGTETTGNTLSVFTYHVLSKPLLLARLKAELREAAANQPPSELMDFRTLERLPCLQASLKEALRLATGVSSRLPRLSRTENTTYTTPSGNPYVFPPKTVISMSILDLHYNEDIFTNAASFEPDRWLESSGERLHRMERAFAPFGRGARMCVGLELAKQEITLVMGNLLHQFDLELYETTARDVSIVHDYFAPWGPDDSKGVRVLAK